MEAIELQELELTNFGSWKHLKFDLEKRGPVFIIGKMGAGKSSIGVGLYWTLTGETPRARPADEIINDEVGYNTSGRVVARYGQTVYEVIRYRKHKAWKNKVVLIKNGVRFGEKDSKVSKINSEIARIFGSKEDLKRKLILAQRSESFPSLSDTEQKNLIELLTELRVIPSAEAITKAKLRHVRNLILTLKERRTQQTEAIRSTRKIVQEQKKHVSKQARVIQASIKEARSRLREARTKRKLYHQEFTEIQQAERKLNRSIMETEAEVSTLRESVKKLEDRLHKLSKLKPGAVCDRCGSVMTEEGIATSITTLEKELHQTSEDLITKKRLVTEKKTSIKDNHQSRKLEKQFREAERKVVRWKEYLRGKASELEQSPDLYTARNTVVMLKRNRQLTLSTLQFMRRVRMQLKHLYAGFYRKGYIRTRMLPVILDALEKKTNKYLLNVDTLRVKYSIEDGRIKQRYARIDQRFKSYASLSGGEQQLVGRCTDLALGELSSESQAQSIDCLILDEPWEGLDATAIEQVPKIIRQIKKNTILIISHSHALRPYFKQVIEVTKRNGASSFV